MTLLRSLSAVGLVFVACASHAHDGKHAAPPSLPLGDGKISATPQVGHVMACNTRFPGGGGAHRLGEWIRTGPDGKKNWYPAEKPQVEGSVNWPNAAITVEREGAERVVRANNLPTHASGEFPIRPGSRAHGYDRNPNRIAERTVLLRLPAKPQAAPTPGCVPMGMIGFALSGVAIFNAFDLAGRDAPAYEIQDSCNGHPERNGQYHYHDWSPCLATKPDGSKYAHNEPVGWMLDGYPILGPHKPDGSPYKNEDLDACHGSTSEVLIDGQLVKTYHYRFTLEYPYTVGCFRGQAVKRN